MEDDWQRPDGRAPAFSCMREWPSVWWRTKLQEMLNGENVGKQQLTLSLFWQFNFEICPCFLFSIPPPHFFFLQISRWDHIVIPQLFLISQNIFFFFKCSWSWCLISIPSSSSTAATSSLHICLHFTGPYSPSYSCFGPFPILSGSP